MRKVIELPVNTDGWAVVPEYDDRDFLFGDIVKDMKLVTTDNTKNFHKVINQNNGSCAGEGYANNAFYATDDFCNGEATYVYAKKNLCPHPDIEGTTSLAITKAGYKFGAVREALYPRLPRLENWKLFPELTPEVIADAATRKSTGFFQCRTISEYSEAIRTQGVVKLALLWLSSYSRPEIDKKTGKAFVQFPNGSFLGGHLVLACGCFPEMRYTYENGITEEGFGAFINTHGQAYGRNGIVYFPLRMLEEKLIDFPVPYCMDMRVSVLENTSPIKIIKSDVASTIVADRSFLPVRVIAEALGATVDFSNSDRSITLKKDDKEVVFYTNKNRAIVNGVPEIMDVSPFIISLSYGDRTLLPIRYVAEFLGADQVIWDYGRVEIIKNNTSVVKFIGDKHLIIRQNR